MRWLRKTGRIARVDQLAAMSFDSPQPVPLLIYRKTAMRSHCLMAIGLALLAAFAPPVCADTIKVYSSNALQEAMGALLPMFERSSGHKIDSIFEPTNAILERLKKGEPADVVMLIKQSLQPMRDAGELQPGTETDIARVSMGIAVRQGAPRPDLSSVEAFKRYLGSTDSLVLAKVGASGIEFTKALQKQGLYEELKPRIRTVEGAARTAEWVARGEGQVAVQMMSELRPVAGVQAFGPLPGDFNFQIVLTAAQRAGSSAGASQIAAELIRFISSPAAKEILREKGMDPL